MLDRNLTTYQQGLLMQVLWRLGLDSPDLLVETHGHWPNITLVTRLTECRECYTLQDRDDCLLQTVSINKYGGLTFELLLDVKVYLRVDNSSQY